MLSLGATFAISTWITLRVAIYSPDVLMPSVLGTARAEAESKLRAVGLVPTILGERHDELAPAGIVLDQFPPRDTRTKSGREVKLTLSLGPQNAVVPRVTDGSYQRAVSTLQALGLQTSKGEIHDTRARRGEVIAQDPVPERTVASDDRVRLLVSLGPEPLAYLMPDLHGQPVDRVVTLLSSRGIQAIRVDGADTIPGDTRRVMRQTPQAGYRLQLNQTVELSTEAGGT
jgi:serine/threonine-protein kinase